MGIALIAIAFIIGRATTGTGTWTNMIEVGDLIQERAGICNSCGDRNDDAGGVRLVSLGHPVDAVACKACGCGGLSIKSGRCPKNLWPDHRTKLLLKCSLPPGDVMMLTAAIRDLHAAHPRKYKVSVETNHPDIWLNNPHVEPLDPDDSYTAIECHYSDAIQHSNSWPLHFIHGYANDLAKKLDIPLYPITQFKGDIHLSAVEQTSPGPLERMTGYTSPYWLLVAGGKHDLTGKYWAPNNYAAVVERLKGRVRFVRVGARDDFHPPIPTGDTIDLVGRTTLRELILLMYHAQGVVCPVTLAMHLAAAVPVKHGGRLRPAVVIAGGREPAHWEQYPGHRFLDTVGALDCCDTGGCWKSRAQPMYDGKDGDLCKRPVSVPAKVTIGGRQLEQILIPECMSMIGPEKVADAVAMSTPKPVGIDATTHTTPLGARDTDDHTFVRPGLVRFITTYGGAPYIHLSLELQKQRWKPIHTRIFDDNGLSSASRDFFQSQYDVFTYFTTERLGHYPGDVSAFVAASAHGWKLTVKTSCRWVWTDDAWIDELLAIANESGAPTITNIDKSHGYGFRTECIAIRGDLWNNPITLGKLHDYVERRKSDLVEGFIHGLARELDIAHACTSLKWRNYKAAHQRGAKEGGYAVWPGMGESRKEKMASRLWHDIDTPDDYVALAQSIGLKYTVEDFLNPLAEVKP